MNSSRIHHRPLKRSEHESINADNLAPFPGTSYQPLGHNLDVHRIVVTVGSGTVRIPNVPPGIPDGHAESGTGERPLVSESTSLIGLVDRVARAILSESPLDVGVMRMSLRHGTRSELSYRIIIFQPTVDDMDMILGLLAVVVIICRNIITKGLSAVLQCNALVILEASTTAA